MLCAHVAVHICFPVQACVMYSPTHTHSALLLAMQVHVMHMYLFAVSTAIVSIVSASSLLLSQAALCLHDVAEGSFSYVMKE